MSQPERAEGMNPMAVQAGGRVWHVADGTFGIENDRVFGQVAWFVTAERSESVQDRWIMIPVAAVEAVVL